MGNALVLPSSDMSILTAYCGLQSRQGITHSPLRAQYCWLYRGQTISPLRRYSFRDLLPSLALRLAISLALASYSLLPCYMQSYSYGLMVSL